jgi:RimJ/RimL family protein N-acetyltransferase
MEVDFRPLRESDLPLVHDWLGREHVSRWWGGRGALEDTVAHYRPSLDGRDPTDLYAIVLDGRDVGMIQAYLVEDDPDFAELAGVEPGVAGIDVFLGEAELLGRGIGTRVIDAFVRDVVLARPGTHACVADPDLENVASLRAFEKAGFRRAGEFVDPGDGKLHALVRRERGTAIPA